MNDSHPLPWLLGLGGLVPFVGLAAALASGQTLGWPADAVSLALALYAATIASFLGGIRWGLAAAAPARDQAWTDYVVSVLPQLLAWACFALAARPRLIALGVLILALGPLDLLLVGRNLAPPWFGRLRIVLSVGAGFCLLVAALV